MIDRYSRKEISRIWELENKFRIWLDIEIAVCEARAERGEIPDDDLKAIKEKAGFDVARILAIEDEVHHDVIAFLTAVGERVGPASRYIHYGLTSSDIVDTALSIQLRESGGIIVQGIERLIGTLKGLALKYKDTPCMGRTHGVHAEPTTFGLKIAVLYEEFRRSRDRILRAIESISYGKFSGAVGTYSNIDPEIEKRTCEKLGLKPDPISTQIIQRDRHAEFMAVLAICAGSLDKLATEVRHLHRTEVREAEEPFQEGQKGSSAMPHKRNPILCERISGISRVVKANMNVALDDMTLWHERDISHSSAERIILPDSTIALDYLVHRMIFVMENLKVYPENMLENMNRSGGLYHTQSLLLALVGKGFTREQAYKIVQDMAMRVWAGEGSLRDLCRKEPAVAAKFASDELERIFDAGRYMKHVDYIFRKIGLL
jgi:adenylosuccinate lyase